MQELLDNQFKIYFNEELNRINKYSLRSQCPRGLRRRSAAARLLRLWVRISLGLGCFSIVSVVCCQVEISATRWSLAQRSPTDCRCVWSRNLVNEEALVHWWLSRQKQTLNISRFLLKPNYFSFACRLYIKK